MEYFGGGYIQSSTGPNPEGLALSPKNGYINKLPQGDSGTPSNSVVTNGGVGITTDAGDPIITG